MAKQNPTSESKNPPTDAWANLVDKAVEGEEIHPRLDFGPKGDTMSFVVRFIDNAPRSIEMRDKFAPKAEWVDGKPPKVSGMVIICQIEADSPNGIAGEKRTVFLKEDAGQHSLTGKLASLAKKWNGLKNVRARISTHLYNHPQYGANTRGYNVSDLGRVEGEEAL